DVLCVVEGTRRVDQIEDTLQWHPMCREHLGSDVVAACIEKLVRQPMHIVDQLWQVKVNEVLMDLIECRICIQMSGDLVSQDAKIGLKGDISIGVYCLQRGVAAEAIGLPLIQERGAVVVAVFEQGVNQGTRIDHCQEPAGIE